MKKQVIIFGIGMMAKIAFFYFSRDKKIIVKGFTINQNYINTDQKSFFDLPIYPFEEIEKYYPPNEFDLFIAIGPDKMNFNREKKFIEAKEKGYFLTSYVSPYSICDSPFGENCFIGDMAIIHPYVSVGANNYIWEYVLLGNDSKIGNNCYFSPRSTISTFCTIGNNCVIGTSSVIKTGVHVADQTFIGASCYISKNTETRGVFGEKNSSHLGNISHKLQIS